MFDLKKKLFNFSEHFRFIKNSSLLLAVLFIYPNKPVLSHLMYF